MGQKDRGLHALLSRPKVYGFVQDVLGGRAFRRMFAEKYLRVAPGDRVLDIGCGTAQLLAYLPDGVEYEGFDLSPKYIDAAQRRFGDRGRFYCQSVAAADLQERAPYEVVVAAGLIHHLDDDEAAKLFQIAAAALKQGGRLVTLDCCYTEDQSLLSRVLIRRDRGNHVRWADGYIQLARQSFLGVDYAITHDLLVVPYTHIFLTCTNPVASGR
jgi:SAM-dependent methyltransferase